MAASSPRSLPSGVVTFLCADIEGSTRLVQRLGDGWGAVLAETRRLLRDAVAAAGGLEIDATGDELFSAFEQPGPAIEAARTGQAAVHGHPWPGGIDVRVRMGIHTGVPMLGEDGYVGLDVHRAHRICSAGHGGQVLISEAAS